MVYRSFLEVLAGSHLPRYAASLKPSSPRFTHSSGFRRLKAHKQLPILKAALAAHHAKHTTKQKLEDKLKAA